jgi:hypothetical protein
MASEEVVVPLPGPISRIAIATHVRSTLLCTSIKALRDRGLFERYLRALDPKHHDMVLSLTAGLWLPVEVAVEHYLACDRLDLPPATVEEIGSEVGRRINESVVSVLVKASRELGVTPWAALAQLPKLTERLWQGSANAVYKLGPKDARMEWYGQPCASSPYFQFAFTTFVTSVLDLFCAKSYARRIPRLCSNTSMGYRLSWA